ncbi:hypothetical protein PBY51_022222 [Eleginops maclovinus]|uniref:Uncharacterized protein n=1 Tax=Eleginops maclovinus TaxID=56733 RepID=A0AAN7XCL4_ELEMC|nr:hypothetical protein PBY51_022222 [Eleginops maclovinus]
MCAAVQSRWLPLHAPSPHHSAPPPTLPLLLLLRPHYGCVSSERAATSYLSAGMVSFMSAGHRFNTQPGTGMTGGLAADGRRFLRAEVIADRQSEMFC